jgi:REP element-mobilizing transposase RayT
MKTFGRIPWSEPLAYYLTWTCYGTWLPGDERGWAEKPGEFREPDAAREAAAREKMTETALVLDEEQRRLVEKTIAHHCQIRGWVLHAVNCRMRHVHAVVTAPNRDPSDVMDQFKAWCTRRLKELAKQREPSVAVAKTGGPSEAASDGSTTKRVWWRQSDTFSIVKISE